MIGHPDGPEVAQAFLTGLLSGLLGTANARRRSDKTGVSVGALGFPASGVMGTALEIALGPADAFGFLMTDILDRMDAARPFFGYVSIRVCSQTRTLVGMQQFGDPAQPFSVMIEVVAFASSNSLAFMRDLQQRTADKITGGLDAMLHWGLENDRINGGHLRKVLGLRRPASANISKLDTFKAVRALIGVDSPATVRPFDNSFTSRLWLDAGVADDDPWSFQTVVRGSRKASTLGLRNTGHAPMRIVGAWASGDFRLRELPGLPGQQPNLEVGPIPAAATPVGDIFELPIAFTAREPGLHTGVLTLVTHADAPDSIRLIRVQLHALVESLDVSLIDPAPPASLDLGTVRAGDTKTVGVVVQSHSTVTAVLDSYECADADAGRQLAVATLGVGSLAPGDTKTYWVSLTPDTIGAFATELRLRFVGGGLAQPDQLVTLPVVASVVGPQATLEPPTLDFGTLTVGAVGLAQVITLRNVGTEPLTVASTLAGNGFLSLGQPPSSLAPGQAAALEVRFRPAADGLVTSSYTVGSNSARPPAPVVLTGIGVLQPYLTAAPVSVAFGMLNVGSTSGEQTVVVTNAGVLAVTLSGFALTGPDAGEFVITANDRKSGDVLRPELTCTIRLQLVPTAPGPKAATLEVAHDGAPSPLRILVEGSATTPLGLAPSVTTVDFGDVAVGSSSGRRRVTLTNYAAGPVTVTSVDLAGLDPGDFRIVSEDATKRPLAPGARCAITLACSPSVLGARDAELLVSADVACDPVPLHANGLEVRPQWSLPSLDFSTWLVGQTSQRQEVTLHNAGNATVLVTSVGVTGDYLVQDLAATFPTIPPNGDKYFWVWFRPSTQGVSPGELVVQTDQGALPGLPLVGTGA